MPQLIHEKKNNVIKSLQPLIKATPKEYLTPYRTENELCMAIYDSFFGMWLLLVSIECPKIKWMNQHENP